MFPQTQFLLFFVVPMPAWLFAGGIFAVSPLLLHIHSCCCPSTIYIVKDHNTRADTQYDLFGALYRPNSTTDSAGHLGGIVAGLGAAMLFRKGRFPRGPRLR
jgi:rhomboid-like protein